MATARKRKSARTPTKTKKAKAASEDDDEEAVTVVETNLNAEEVESMQTVQPQPDSDCDNQLDTSEPTVHEDLGVVNVESKNVEEETTTTFGVDGEENADGAAVSAENGQGMQAPAQADTIATFEGKEDTITDDAVKTRDAVTHHFNENGKTQDNGYVDDHLKEGALNNTLTNEELPDPEPNQEEIVSQTPAIETSQMSNPVSDNPGVHVPLEENEIQGVPTAYMTPVPVTIAPVNSQIIEERGEVSMLFVGRVIGKGGEMIRDLQARSGCRIDVDQNVPEGAPRIITYRGTRSTIDFAKQLVALLCKEGGSEADLPLGHAVKKLVLVPSTVIGKIIGRGGEMIRELQSKSTAKIQVDHNATGEQRHINVTGTEQSVAKAEEMILFLAANPAVDAHEAIAMLIRDKTVNGGVWGSGPPYPNLPHNGQGMPGVSEMMPVSGVYGGGGAGYAGPPQPTFGSGYGMQSSATYGQQHYSSSVATATGIITEIFPCPKMYMGRVIGQKGLTINDLQKRSGCDIQINQNVPVGHDCEICIKGSMQGIMVAKQMLQEIIEMGPNHPYAGGHGQQGGRSHFVGQQGSYQQQHQPYQQSGFVNPMYHAQSYPAQQQYGVQQPYVGQPLYQQQPYQPQQSMYGAPPGMPMPLAQVSPWRSATAADGQVYYYNQNTGETQWDKPPGMP